MFAGWFSPKVPTQDRVWLDADACMAGLQRDVAVALLDGHAVLLVLRGATELGDAARALAAHSPRVCDDRYAATDLQSHVATAAALGITQVEALRPTPAIAARATALQVHVRSRGDRRSDDQCLLALLKAWRPAAVVFHHALDDRLLRDHAASLRLLLARFGVGSDEGVSSALVGRAIQRLQRP